MWKHYLYAAGFRAGKGTIAAAGADCSALADDDGRRWVAGLSLDRSCRPGFANPVVLVEGAGGDSSHKLGTGECFSDASLALRTFRTRVVGGMIEVELDG